MGTLAGADGCQHRGVTPGSKTTGQQPHLLMPTLRLAQSLFPVPKTLQTAHLLRLDILFRKSEMTTLQLERGKPGASLPCRSLQTARPPPLPDLSHRTDTIRASPNSIQKSGNLTRQVIIAFATRGSTACMN